VSGIGAGFGFRLFQGTLRHASDTDYNDHAYKEPSDRQGVVQGRGGGHACDCIGDVHGHVSKVDFHEQTRYQPHGGDEEGREAHPGRAEHITHQDCIDGSEAQHELQAQSSPLHDTLYRLQPGVTLQHARDAVPKQLVRGPVVKGCANDRAGGNWSPKAGSRYSTVYGPRVDGDGCARYVASNRRHWL